jgi:hypothetical protein
MEHKGIRYTVVQTAAPTGWRWSIELTPPLKSRCGQSHSRGGAIRKAQSVIDKLQPARDGGTIPQGPAEGAELERSV